MADSAFFLALASRCRALIEAAKQPDVIEQLRFWVDEFEAEACAAEVAEFPATSE